MLQRIDYGISLTTRVGKSKKATKARNLRMYVNLAYADDPNAAILKIIQVLHPGWRIRGWAIKGEVDGSK